MARRLNVYPTFLGEIADDAILRLLRERYPEFPSPKSAAERYHQRIGELSAGRSVSKDPFHDHEDEWKPVDVGAAIRQTNIQDAVIKAGATAEGTGFEKETEDEIGTGGVVLDPPFSSGEEALMLSGKTCENAYQA